MREVLWTQSKLRTFKIYLKISLQQCTRSQRITLPVALQEHRMLVITNIIQPAENLHPRLPITSLVVPLVAQVSLNKVLTSHWRCMTMELSTKTLKTKLFLKFKITHSWTTNTALTKALNKAISYHRLWSTKLFSRQRCLQTKEKNNLKEIALWVR